MKNLIFFLLFSSLYFISNAQSVGIGTTTPDPSAALDITSTDGGLLIPRVDTANITSPANGLLTLYNNIIWQYTGSKWSQLSGEITDADGDTKIQAVDGVGNTDVINFQVNGHTKLQLRSNGLGDQLIHFPDDLSPSQNLFIGKDAGLDVVNNSGIEGLINTGIGYSALRRNTTGSENTAIGVQTLRQNLTGNKNTALGGASMDFNTSGNNNTGLGTFTLNKNRTGSNNTGVGNDALRKNVGGLGNTGIGAQSLTSNTEGISNTAVGFASMESNTTGVFNSALGVSALSANLNGNSNTAIGINALSSNTDGSSNTAVGRDALNFNTNGLSNNAYGNAALRFNMTGNQNVAVGDSALYSSTVSSQVAVGHSALRKNTTGASNSALGFEALYSNVGGDNNSALGFQALYSNIDGSSNSALGEKALFANTSGGINTAVGAAALSTNSTGRRNTGVGSFALQQNTIGIDNSAIGKFAMISNTIGNENIALGSNALSSNVGNSGSTAIGFGAMENADNRSSGRETFNTAVGHEALKGSSNISSNTGENNTAVGSKSLTSNSTGEENTALGTKALQLNTSGDKNTALGFFALGNNDSGGENVAVGPFSLIANLSGSNNTAIESGTLSSNQGSGNVALGWTAGSLEAGDNKLYIENSAADKDGALIYGDFANDFLRVNDRLSIGGDPESYPLTIQGDATEDLMMLKSSDNAVQWHMKMTGSTEKNLNFVESGVIEDRFVLREGGNVGIGIAAPEKNLHIKASTPTIKLQATEALAEAGRVSLRDPTGGGVDLVYGGGTGDLSIEAHTTNLPSTPLMTFNRLTGKVKLKTPFPFESEFNKNLVIGTDGTIGTKEYEIGDKAFGGVIFWIDESGEHGLVLAFDEFDDYWQTPGPATTFDSGARSDGYRGGKMNTTLIIAANTPTITAAFLCSTYLGGGQSYGDWYLPNISELEEIYSNKTTLNSALSGNDLLTDFFYWSSNEGGANNLARILDMTNGSATGGVIKGTLQKIRPVRAF